MTLSRATGFCLACGCVLALLTTACRTSVVGHYELDLDETKKAVDQSVAEHPEQAQNKQGVVDMLSSGKLDIGLTEDGKMTSAIQFSPAPGQPANTQKNSGTWKLNDKQLVIQAEHDRDTVCDVDGKRLRCKNDGLPDLMSRFVLVRK